MIRRYRYPLCKFKLLKMSDLNDGSLSISVGITLAFIEFDVIPSPKVGYLCRDPSLSHPFNGDTISAVSLTVGSFLAPLVLLTLLEFKRNDQKNSLLLIWRWYKEMLVGIIATLMITEVMKVIIGEHRPHFISTCVPDAEATCTEGEFVKQYRCTNTYYSFYTVGDSSRSFPSGHTSLSVFASLFCAVSIVYLIIFIIYTNIEITFAQSFLYCFHLLSSCRTSKKLSK